jgi:hypothetical protein
MRGYGCAWLWVRVVEGSSLLHLDHIQNFAKKAVDSREALLRCKRKNKGGTWDTTMFLHFYSPIFSHL